MEATSAFTTVTFLLPLLPSAIIFTLIENQDIRINVCISAAISMAGYLTTTSVIPVVAKFTLKRNICGKDLGKKGTARESMDVPEALGLVPGTVFIMCAILSQLYFAKSDRERMIYNSALFSVCFMVFLGFCDDVLDLAWRYKLILPTIASLPLLASYSGNTAIYIPEPFQKYFMADGKITTFGSFIDMFAVVDTEANGAIIELGLWFLLFMGLLAVFCTNSINIYAGINGLECGQAYIIGCSILFFKLYDIYKSDYGENQIFAIAMILPFIGSSLSLLRYNWFPAKVFVGDTFCYFSGMTFAVVGIHGHFSKTLLLLFAPQIFNFLYSIPQLFKIIPCPRHRLPRIDPKTQLLHCSTFECSAEQYNLFKKKRGDLECPNMTLLCVFLRVFGPMKEERLTVCMLCLQVLSTVVVFFIRYVMLSSGNLAR